MAQRPKRSVPRRDYASLADLKLPRIKKSNNRSTPRLSDSEGEANGEFYRVEVVEENTATSQVKVRYIGYSTSFDEWREKEEIVDLSDSDSEDGDVPTEFPSGTIQRFCLLQELAVRIKQSLISSRKGNPVCHIVMSFDKIFFDSLAVRGALQSKAGRSSRVHTRQVYTISHMKHFEDLLGARWYIRGLNTAGDFCFVTPGTVEFYLRETKGKVDYQLESDGSMRQFYFGKDIDDNCSGIKTRTAKNVVNSVIVKALYSIPGYSALEDYKDRICSTLPGDYNNTAVRLQTLIGASDHMIQWILTGDMSKVNHRIYQVVLVYVCFEPHFIKFCDIMEVLVADDRYIMELRTTLITQLQRDNYITAKEAFQLTSIKLFTSPVPVVTTIPVNNANSNAMTDSCSTNKNNPSCSVMQIVKTSQHTDIHASGSVVEKSNCPARPIANTSAGNANNFAILSSMQYAVQSSQCTNSIDAAENLIDNDLPYISSESGHDSTVDTSCLTHSQQNTSVKDAINVGITNSEDLEVKCVSLSEDEKLSTSTPAHDGIHDNKIDTIQTCVVYEEIVHVTTTSTQHIMITANRALENANPSTKESPSASLDSNPSSNEAKNVTDVLSLTKSRNSDQIQVSEEKNAALLPNNIEKFQEVSGDSEETKVTVSAEAKLDANTSEFGSKEVQEILETKDFAIVKAKYHEIIACLPENHEAIIASLLEHLSDFQICDILSMTAGQAQKILNYLILRLKSKEDLLDFCDNLEKVQEAPGSLKALVEQLRKETIEIIQRNTDSKHESEKPSTAATPKAPPERPPYKYLPFHPALLVIPKATNPFDLCQLTDDSKGLGAIKKCYPILIENLPSNHLTTLVRLQDVAIIPEEIVDSIVPSPSAEIGNKMIINYLIGLIHTDEHIITFCYFAERMLGEFDKCICVLNLKNTILMLQKCERIYDDANEIFTAKTDRNFNVLVDISCDELKTRYADQPDIRALTKAEKPSIFYQPFLHNCGSMVGYSKCLLINSHGHSHSENIQSSSTEILADESSPNSDMVTVKDYIKRDYLKEYAFSLSDGQAIQLSRQQCFESIEILFKESVRGAVMIYYTGCGEEGTGNWCFKDGVISFTDILSLYDKHLKERLLTIYADCSYSGQWVLDYANYLDEMGIEACGHQLAKQKKFLKIFTSCQPNQKVNSKFYVTKALNFNEKDDSLWVYTNIELSPGQNTYGCNFLQSHCLNLGGPSAPCQISSIPSRFRWSWKDIVDVERDNRPGSRVFTVRGKDKGREAWHIVLVEKDLLKSFHETVSSGTVDVAKFGYVIKSGWGKDPPDDIIKLLKKNC